jgi:hypothetical protein
VNFSLPIDAGYPVGCRECTLGEEVKAFIAAEYSAAAYSCLRYQNGKSSVHLLSNSGVSVPIKTPLSRLQVIEKYGHKRFF